jgi:allantoin racemase
MQIVLINPNTTASFTTRIGEAARAVAAPGTRITAVNPPDGPVSIEGYFDEAYSVPGLLGEMARYEQSADAASITGYVIACFDDTGLDAARCAARAPVVGIGEAAFHLASLVAGKFSVITTLGRSVPALEHNLVRYGLASRWMIRTLPRERVLVRKVLLPFGRTGLRRSCSDAPAWPISPRVCRASLACR